MPKIEINSLGKVFPNPTKPESTVALDNINLTIDEGELVTLIGPSGAGKTTLLEIIAGLQTPSVGTVLINGNKVCGPRAETNLVFQEFAIFPWRNVLDNVAFGLELRKMSAAERYEIARYYINLVKLEGVESSYPHQLSGGMKQRVGLARALATNPDILLMDEPFGSVDALSRMQLQEDLIRILQEEQKTIVFVTHDINEAVYLADRVLIMTPRPGTINHVFTVTEQRPRSRTSKSIIDIAERIFSCLGTPQPKTECWTRFLGGWPQQTN